MMAYQFIPYPLLLQSLSSFCWQSASGQVGDFYIVSQVQVQSSYFTVYMVGCKPYDSILVHISVQVPSCKMLEDVLEFGQIAMGHCLLRFNQMPSFVLGPLRFDPTMQLCDL